MKFLLRLIVILAIAMSGTVAYMITNESDYIFFPEKTITQTPQAAGLHFTEQTFQTTDGVTLHGWYMPQRNASFTLLHMHGNAGNMSDRIEQYRRWQAMGLSVFAFDYRGYGKSDGAPDEAGLYEDARAAWKLLTGTFGIAPQRIIIAGRSLGGSVAAQLASEVKPAGLALEVPFTSIPDMSADHYPWLPLRWLVKNRFDTEQALGKIKVPLLLISAREDEIVPGWMEDRLFAADTGEKLRGKLPGGHNDFDSISQGPYIKLWQIWLDSLTQPEDTQLQWVRRLSTNGA
ncbi:MAG: alpha/beta hydrolase [Zetaproteobacteria bacterium CG12_big_fil_rev_8_21_14_0_65_55_1124]|nr:MAG: alpha/beta hydrolase [Zetaproteobacteria bacterium CG08_land_8_20_14_0_20_55_17]PIW43058.1 MAG: alpha/beta hydrolase [Zetaproteobacteria bacterium CG12_big_fil_rev_8_21_14_0_65_55_1124]PIY51342.1 MAG: alpha/beta hydrolase [Zetaproteobacteria bacterium CG_4_10_14_0_8_um_filter_55_43]PIZ37984.1 MAG: alpha/beta hydrolase [Zetaproteobacteria bacterium CG_4_10_14_0_2_um_filter_55_20]PJB81883.1 MAG: alpha/beta hydrolase [Zetaproteobacteria bacterium CG_4_9_14_0_8_um_filter_55_31]